jgi:cytochrome c biogenesis protein CcmG, thiol:disulfide interchange protein DsbE
VRTILLSLVWLGGLASSVRAADQHLDTLQVGKLVYSNVTVLSTSPTALFIQHTKGVGSVKLKDLSPELQQKFGYDAQKAAAVEALQKKGQVDYVKTLTNASPTRTAPESVSKLYAKPFMNQPGPEVVIEKWLSDPAETADKFFLLEFWATWCGPCRASIPHLNELRRRYGDRLVIVGLSDEAEADVRKLTDPRIEYSSAIDTQRRTMREVEVSGIPHVLLMDPKGIVRFQGLPGDLTEEKLEKILDQFAR